MINFCSYKSPLGDIYIMSDSDEIIKIELFEDKFSEFYKHNKDILICSESSICRDTAMQLDEYFQGKRKEFNLQLKVCGTDFQKSVWQELCKIPFGESRSYQYIAERIGKPKAVRAVGQANKANRFPIVIPCHRVIGKNGKLTGYAGVRIDVKQYLLDLERGGSINV